MSRIIPPRTLARTASAVGALGVGVTFAASAHAASPFAHAAVGACSPRYTRVHGLVASIGCGPATAKLTISGHTYSFHGGQCILSNGTLTASIGEDVARDHKHNGDKPYFAMSNDKTSGGVFAYVSGKSLVGFPGFTTATKGLAGRGTFHGETPDLKQTPFHGSWNCHGAVVTGL